jgi:predicted dehydrogenase
MKTYTIGMVGYGHWGKLLYRYFNLHKGFRIVQIATRHPETIEGNFPEGLVLSTPDEVLDNTEIDAVVVATPMETHYSLISKALLRNKHVFAEKPLTLKAAEAKHLTGIAEEKNLVLFTDYILTLSPGLRKMIELAKSRAIGKISGCCFVGRQLGHGGKDIYWDLGCHVLSVLHLLIPLDSLEFSRIDIFSSDGIIETGQLLFRGNSSEHKDFAGSILLSFNYPFKERNMSIFGDEGTLVYDITREKPLAHIRYTKKPWSFAETREKDTTHYESDEFNTIEETVMNFYRILNREIASNGEMAVKVTEVLENLGR